MRQNWLYSPEMNSFLTLHVPAQVSASGRRDLRGRWFLFLGLLLLPDAPSQVLSFLVPVRNPVKGMCTCPSCYASRFSLNLWWGHWSSCLSFCKRFSEAQRRLRTALHPDDGSGHLHLGQEGKTSRAQRWDQVWRHTEGLQSKLYYSSQLSFFLHLYSSANFSCKSGTLQITFVSQYSLTLLNCHIWNLVKVEDDTHSGLWVTCPGAGGPFTPEPIRLHLFTL